MHSRHRQLAAAILLTIFLILLVLLARFLWHRHYYAVTNAVFVETDSLVLVSFQKVNGRLRRLYVPEGARVQQGQILAELDNTTYALSVRNLADQLRSLREKSRALSIEIQRLRTDLRLRQAQIEDEMERLRAERRAMQSEVAALEAELAQTARDLRRFRRLLREGLIARHRFEEIQTRWLSLTQKKKALLARVQSLTAAIRSTVKEKERLLNQHKLIREKERELAALKARIRARERALEEARVLLFYCRLQSPVTGYIAKRFHAPGDVVGPGEPVYAVVDFSKLYVLVLLEETKLRGVRPGCEARIRIDAYPHHPFYGVVTAVLPATAAKFALVPRDISAGEFTKVAQRIPVKIKITRGDLSLLRVGLGGEVEIKRKF